jgi:hypothetical protein
MDNRATPPELLKAKQPVVQALARELRLSRWQTYGLLNPAEYPDRVPAGIFDTRSDVATRIASFIDCDVDFVRSFYAEQVAA